MSQMVDSLHPKYQYHMSPFARYEPYCHQQHHPHREQHPFGMPRVFGMPQPGMGPGGAMPMGYMDNGFQHFKRRSFKTGQREPHLKGYPSNDLPSMNDSSDLSDSIDSGSGTVPTTSSGTNKMSENVTSTPSKASRLKRRVRNRNSQSHSFNNQYELIEKEDTILGQGAYATVRLAIRKRDNKRFAVKVIDKNNKSNTREKCFNEMRQLQRCKGAKNILTMHEFYEDVEKYYIVTEFMAGGNLHDRLEEGVALTQYEAASITRDLARALAFLHANRISHRDIKPQNILCKSMTSLSPVVLSDFDLSSADDDNSNASYDFDYSHSPGSPSYGDFKGSENHSNFNIEHKFPMEMDSPVGSPEYMSPEIATRFLIEDEMLCDKYTEATDIWSLGVLLFKALSGDVPFKAVGCANTECQWEEGQACADCQISLWEEICQADLQFKSKIWDSISKQAKHLVTRCLTYCADDRITAAEILEHPFIKALERIDGNEDKEIGSLSSTINSQLVVDSRVHSVQPLPELAENTLVETNLNARSAYPMPGPLKAAREIDNCNVATTAQIKSNKNEKNSNYPANSNADDPSSDSKMTDDLTPEPLQLNQVAALYANLNDANFTTNERLEFLKVLTENPQFQLSFEQITRLDKIENPPDANLHEDLLDQDSGHGVR